MQIAPRNWLAKTKPLTKVRDRPVTSGVAAFNDEPYADHWFEKALDV